MRTILFATDANATVEKEGASGVTSRMLIEWHDHADMSFRAFFGRKRMAIADASETVGTAELAQISGALHDLCQPLTVLQCRLEMGRLMGTPESHRDTLTLALGDCSRLMNAVHAMREIVQRAAGEPVQAPAGETR